jgi:hypothetical protein
MKRLAMLVLTGTLIFGVPVVSYASSLDDVISQSTDVSENSSTFNDSANTYTQDNSYNYSTDTSESTKTNREAADEFMDSLKGAGKLDTTSKTATTVNAGIKKFAAVIVQILSYAIIALLVVRIMVDILYICIPFSRSFLANGYSGNAQAGGGGGMGVGGMAGGISSGFNSPGGFNSGFNSPAPSQMMGGGASPATGRTQWVSEAALNAVAAGKSVDQNNKAVSPLKAYAKDMIPTLVITPILLVLAITGVLTDLGFLLGDVIANAIGGISSML